jgi:hypothetical protein
MGIYVNPGKDGFERAVNSQIYVDKTGLLEYEGDMLLVGVNYDKETKEHTCVIEEDLIAK